MRENKKKIIKITAFVVVVALVVSVFAFAFGKEEKIPEAPVLENTIGKITDTSSAIDYDTYLASHNKVSAITEEKTIEQNKVIAEGEKFTFKIEMAESLAAIKLCYKIKSNNNSDGSVSIEINGKRPFREAHEIVLKRYWKSGETSGDDRGNEYTVPLTEDEEYHTAILMDTTGFHNAPLNFYFKDGVNEITFISEKNEIELKSVTLFAYASAKSYKEVSEEYPEKGRTEALTIEAEKPYLRTNASIAELCDRTSPLTTPKFTGLQKWNGIGGSGWNTIGQSVTWKINLEESGCYNIAFRYRNNFVSGLSTYRKLLIDGEVPFSEMESVQFGYDTDWQTIKLSDEKGNPYLYYLEEGEHTLTLEVTLGEQANALNVAQKSLSRLNEAYRKIIMVTGANPDKYRDYQIEKNLPEVLEMFKEQVEVLEKLSNWLYAKNEGKGEGTVKVDEIIRKLKEFIKYPETLPQYLSAFSGNLTGLSDWIQSCTTQPLTLDTIEFLPENTEPKKAKPNFFKKLSFDTGLFLKSFADDYGVIGSIHDEKQAVEVWISLGRDQYQIMKELIDNEFTQKSNIGVNLKLVAGGILEATVAGIAPDISLFSGEGDPMNFAARGALLDLSKFDNYSEVANRFAPQTLVPYTYDGGVYGIPLTQGFDVLFVRDDILAEIGLEAPKTWDDVYNCLTILQQNNMEFALPDSGSVNGFAMLLFQNQLNIYKDNGKKADINTEAGIEAFTKWTQFYKEYSLLMSYSFVNRFRSGDMPIGIADFSTFNTLEVSAPEISGLWSMHLVPGTVQEDGSIRHVAMSGTTAAMIMKTTELPKESWAFVDWFTTADAQYAYATAIENRQGISGRYATANIEAFNRLSWTAETLKTLNKQRETAMSIEQVPGGYFLNRHINNIFRKIINEDADVRETVNEYTEIINAELTKKRKEFGLEVDE